MAIKFTYTRPDGIAAIVVAAPKASVEQILGPLTDDEFRAHVIARSIPPDAMDAHELPEDWKQPDDRTFRDAWRHRGAGVVNVDMPAARNIWREKMRKARTPLLAALDIEYQRADERGDVAAKADVARRKQELRDVTADPAIEAAQTPEELKAIWPGALGAK